MAYDNIGQSLLDPLLLCYLGYMFYQVFGIILNYFRSYGSKRSETDMLLFTLAARRAKSNMQVLHNKEDEEMNKSRL